MTDTTTILVMYLIIIIFYLVPSDIIFWKLYKKGGQPGWSALIPGYSTYNMGKITKNTTLGTIAGIIILLSWVGSLTGLNKTVPALGFVQLVGFFLAVAILNKFVKLYDAGLGKWFLFIFLPIIGVFLVDKTNFKGTISTPVVPPALSTQEHVPADAITAAVSQPPAPTEATTQSPTEK